MDETTDKDEKRKMRYAVNTVLDTVNKTGMTDMDKKVAEIAELSGIKVDEIIPYQSAPKSMTYKYKDADGKLIKLPDGTYKKETLTLGYNETMLYYTTYSEEIISVYSQVLKICEEMGYDASTTAAYLQLYKRNGKGIGRQSNNGAAARQLR